MKEETPLINGKKHTFKVIDASEDPQTVEELLNDKWRIFQVWPGNSVLVVFVKEE